jgi:hypothetical protein
MWIAGFRLDFPSEIAHNRHNSQPMKIELTPANAQPSRNTLHWLGIPTQFERMFR